MLTCGRRLGATRPPPFLRQFRLASLFLRRFCLGFRPRLSDGSRLFWRSCYRCRLQWPRRRKTGGGKIPRQAQLLRKLLLPAKSRSRFRNLVRDRPLRSFFKGTGSLSNGSVTLSPLPFSNKQPDRPHQMLSGNINIPFPENLGDPMNADPAPVGFQDLFLAFSQGLDLGRFAVPAAFRAARKFDQISGSGFENIRIRISQCESPLFRVYDKEMANWRSNS